MVVVDEFNVLQGIVTRKDLLGFVVEEKVKDEIVRIKRRNVIKKHYKNLFKTRAKAVGSFLGIYKSIIKKNQNIKVTPIMKDKSNTKI